MTQHSKHIPQADLADVLQQFEKDGASHHMRMAIVRNVTIEPLVPYLRYHGYTEGIAIQAHLGQYDAVMVDVMKDAGALYSFKPEMVLVILHLAALSPLLWYDFSRASPEQRQAEIECIIGTMHSIIAALRQRCPATIVINGFEVPAFPAGGIADLQQKSGQVRTIRELNDRLLELCASQSGVHFVDLELLTARVGVEQFTDARYWHIGRIPYTALGWDLLAGEYLKFVRALKGKTRKCLVLDCDNTLWGGIVGESGLNGIALDVTFPGSAFVDFQKVIRELHDRGVLLALCSKNNEADVLEVLDRHPHMALRRDCFASIKINWNDKASNIRAIAEELRLGLDAFVFFDDSAFEIDFVRRVLPMVTCRLLPADPTTYRDLILSCGLFDSPTLSEEDRRRTAMYSQETARRSARIQVSAGDLASYLSSLDQVATVALADEFSLTRIAQLTQKTNQFNLTTRRYTESHIRDLSASSSSEVFYLHLRDKFGDSGIVGACIIAFSGDRAIIDTLLLSCRVIGRDADTVLLKAALDRCAARPGIKTVVGLFQPTEKNGQVHDFYPRHGFSETRGDGDLVAFALGVSSIAGVTYPGHFKEIIAFGAPATKNN